jgi:Flp pilus assembly protein TadG
VVRGRRPDPETGQVLVVALVAVLLLAAAFALVSGTLVSRMQRAQRAADETDLLALTDAAVAETLANLAAWPVSAGVERRSFGGGTIESTVQRGGGKSFTIVAEATVRRGRLSVEVRGRLTELGPVVDSWRRLPPARRGGTSRRRP